MLQAAARTEPAGKGKGECGSGMWREKWHSGEMGYSKGLRLQERSGSGGQAATLAPTWRHGWC